MTLVTPFKPYQLQKDALAQKSKKELSAGMEEVLRKDISRGGGEYRDLLNDLKRLIRGISGNTDTFDEDMATDPDHGLLRGLGLEMQIDRYRSTLMKLDGLRVVDEPKLLAFAAALKPHPGQKTVVFFYQREYQAGDQRGDDEPADGPLPGELRHPEQSHGAVPVLQAGEDLRSRPGQEGLRRRRHRFHFIFMEKKSQRVFGVTMREQSEDIYPGFIEVARATAGTAESSQNPALSFQARRRHLERILPSLLCPDRVRFPTAASGRSRCGSGGPAVRSRAAWAITRSSLRPDPRRPSQSFRISPARVRTAVSRRTIPVMTAALSIPASPPVP